MYDAIANYPYFLQVVYGGMVLLQVFVIYYSWRGWFAGERKGPVPHCRECDFNLTNLFPKSENCPECGARLHVPNAVVGNRIRTWTSLIMPLVLTLLALFMCYQMIDGW